MHRPPFLAMLAVVLPGCASRPLDPDGGVAVEPKAIFQRHLVGAATAPGDGTIRFLRDWGFGGGGCTHEVNIDSARAFSIGVRERIDIHLPAGPHVIQLQNESFVCPSVSVSQETTLQPRTMQVFRIQLPAAGGVSLSGVQ